MNYSSLDKLKIKIFADGANEKEANAIAQRLIRALGTTPIPAMGEGMRLTASFGVAQRREGDRELIEQAHRAD